MSSGTAALETHDMGTSGLLGRNALDISAVRALSQRSDARGLLRFGTHLAVMALTGLLVAWTRPNWWLTVPALVLHGFTLVTMFAPMHECVHRTAFASRALNEIFGWVAGLLSFYNFTYYRYYHTWHHRFTQDPEKDPELSTPKPRNRWEYLVELSGVMFWLRRPLLSAKLATGRTHDYPFIPSDARGKIALSAGLQLGVYGAGIASIGLGSDFAWMYFFLPAILAQPLLRAILIAEHTGCSEDENGLTNTRTTLTNGLIRLLMWNMPYHTEHHLYPSIPFHQLPRAHRELKEKLTHIAPSYVAVNQSLLQALGAPSPSES